MMQVSMVPQEYVDYSWPFVEKYLEGAAKYTYGRYEVEDIYKAIKDWQYTLWVAFDGEKIKGAVVTNVVTYPKKKFLGLHFCGGIELHEWQEPMMKLLQAWAYDNGCDGLEATARLGWAKALKEYNYKPLWQSFEIPAATSGLGENHGSRQAA